MRITIVSAIDETYAQHYDVLLHSILENKFRDSEIEFYLIDGGLSESSVKRFASATREYKALFHLLKIDKELFKDCMVSHHISLAAYYRIIIPDILAPKHEKILYLDADIVVKEDLSELWNTDISNCIVGAVAEKNIPVKHKISLNMPPDADYFNSGVMLINVRKWQEFDTGNKVLLYLKTQAEKIKFWDQDGLNAVLHNNFLKLPEKFNSLTLLLDSLKAKPDAKIIHYIGSLKPWHFGLKLGSIKYYYKYLDINYWKYSPPNDWLFQVFTAKSKYWAKKILSLLIR